MPNEIIKGFLRATGFRQYELAELLDISEGMLTRLFRKDLPAKVQEGMVDVVKAYITGGEVDTGFFQDYMYKRSLLAEARRVDKIHDKYDAFRKQRMLDKALDDMEKRRIDGGWDTIQGGYK